jgi:hypothetical protein
MFEKKMFVFVLFSLIRIHIRNTDPVKQPKSRSITIAGPFLYLAGIL